MNDLAIEPLTEHANLVPVIARWHASETASSDVLDFWAQAHHEEASGQRIPTAWVALASGQPVGCVSLIATNMSTHPELTPWLAALFVVADRRRRGIGTALTRRCEAEAALLDYARLFLYTQNAADFYERLGWRARSVEVYEGQQVVVMHRSLLQVGRSRSRENTAGSREKRPSAIERSR